MLRRGGWSVLGVWGVLGLVAACGGKDRGSPITSASSGAGGAMGTSGGPIFGNWGGGDGNTGGAGSLGEECAADRFEAQRLPLDMYIMLDVSGSMLLPTEGDENVTKWQAVKSALTDFMTDPASAGMGVGLQVFPLRHPAAPASCTRDAECAGFESCFLRVCWNFTDALLPCQTDADCGATAQQGACVTFGECEADPTYVCRAVGESCGVDDTGKALGACQPPQPSQCTLTADCRPESYATPSAPIAALPDASPGLIAALDASTPEANNQTPTGPALQGAIRQAKTWAAAHPDHQVVAVLATDGQPTLRTAAMSCGRVEMESDLQQVVDFAGDGRSSAPPITTFVVGVLSAADSASGAETVLDGVARAGGSDQAFIIDSRGDVQRAFRSALDAIRANGLSCELKVPVGSASDPVSYDEVNVDFTHEGGEKEGLFRVADSTQCAAAPSGRGWYYDTLPTESTPTRITVCPGVCQEFQATDRGSVSIALGCAQRIVK